MMGIEPETKRIHHWCQVGQGNPNLRGPPFHWENEALPSFPLERWTGWDFPVPLYTSWSILFLTYLIKHNFNYSFGAGTVVNLWRRTVKYVHTRSDVSCTKTFLKTPMIEVWFFRNLKRLAALNSDFLPSLHVLEPGLQYNGAVDLARNVRIMSRAFLLLYKQPS